MTDGSTALLLAVDSWGGVATMIALGRGLREHGVDARAF